jgi:hypothetical protein
MIAAVETYLAVRRAAGFTLSNTEYLLRSVFLKGITSTRRTCSMAGGSRSNVRVADNPLEGQLPMNSLLCKEDFTTLASDPHSTAELSSPGPSSAGRRRRIPVSILAPCQFRLGGGPICEPALAIS